MKRLLPLVLVALAVALAVALGMMLIRGPASGPGLSSSPAIKPGLKVLNAAGEVVSAGSFIVAAGAPFDLRITLESSAFVYLFDESQSQHTLVWQHEGDMAWESGEYSAEAPAFEGLGEHQLLLVASPISATTVGTWKVLTPSALATLCPHCETASYSFSVSEPLDAGP